jgi:hypothetical protein
LNSFGVAISTSGVWSRRTVVDLDRLANSWFLINSHLLLRGSRSIDDVWAKLQAQPRTTGLNIVVADRIRGAAFEATADGAVRQDAEYGVVVRSNHYLASELAELSPRPDEHPSSYHRYSTATSRARAQSEHGSWQAEKLIRLTGDHDGYPQHSICRHAEHGVGADTVYASIATLPEGKFWTILEHPCQATAQDVIDPVIAELMASG